MSGIFTIDTGLTTGWAYMFQSNSPIEFGAWELGGGIKEAGKSFAAMEKILDANLTVYKPKLIVKEAPIKTRYDTVEKLALMYGLHAIVELLAYKHGSLLTEIDPRTLKKQFAGNGNADKDDMIHVCRSKGFDVLDHNSADAIALMVVTARNRISGYHL